MTKAACPTAQVHLRHPHILKTYGVFESRHLLLAGPIHRDRIEAEKHYLAAVEDNCVARCKTVELDGQPTQILRAYSQLFTRPVFTEAR